MNINSFHVDLKKLRKEKNLSQTDFVDKISNSHRVFSNVTQSMISLWEKGDIQPSLVRRIGIANFFGVGYQYSENEIPTIKKKCSFREVSPVQPTFFDYSATGKRAISFSELSERETQWLNKAFFQRSGNKFSIIQVIKWLGITNINVIIYYHYGAIVGMLVYAVKYTTSYIYMISSLGYENWDLIMKDLYDMKGIKNIFVLVNNPTMKKFFSDIFFTKKDDYMSMTLFYGDFYGLVNNNFFVNMKSHSAEAFRKLCHYPDL